MKSHHVLRLTALCSILFLTGVLAKPASAHDDDYWWYHHRHHHHHYYCPPGVYCK